MTHADEGCVFECRGEALVGVLSRATVPGAEGMVVIVGGPQYRAGSHRQFVLLARRAAAAGFSTLRFDYRGMGDSGGEPVGFEGADEDVKVAIDTLIERCPSIRRVFLWGLCDGASAALLYLQRTGDARVAGVCILNPWIRTAESLARVQVRHYYRRRFFQLAFWRKLVIGDIDIRNSISEYFAKRKLSAVTEKSTDTLSFRAKMAAALRDNPDLPVLLILSGGDLTAKEFIEYATSDPVWPRLLGASTVVRLDISGADHTFSQEGWSRAVEEATLSWIRQILQGAGRHPSGRRQD